MGSKSAIADYPIVSQTSNACVERIVYNDETNTQINTRVYKLSGEG